MNPTTPTTAGRDVDAEVAIKIMGYHRFKELCIITTWNSPDKKLIDEKDVPHYSTNISAAMEVVKRMKELGFAAWFSNAHKDGWEVSFIKMDGIEVNGELDFQATAPTLELAITLAALKAVGGRGE